MRKILGRITVVMLMMALLVTVPVRVDAASKLNWKKWETVCGETNVIKVTGAKSGKYKYQGKYYPIKYLSSDKNASSSKRVIKVDKNGKVTAVRPGSATVDVYIRVGLVHQTIGTCKVKVSHDYETTNTEYKTASLYNDGGTYVTSVCKGCKNKKVTIKNREPFYYTEEIVREEMDRIVNISQNECPFKFDTSSRFLNWLVDNGYVPESVLEASDNTKGTIPGNYDNAKGKHNVDCRGQCSDGTHSIESCLMGIADRQYVLIHDCGRKDGFNFQTNLKAGDVLYFPNGLGHMSCFKSYVRFDDGTVYMQCYTGYNGELVYEEYEVMSPEDIGETYFLEDAAVYRLPNYK